jgi:hypothetical protein
VASDDRTREMDVAAWLPAQRAVPDEVSTEIAATGGHADETMLLPVFVTGNAPATPEVAPAPVIPEAAPPPVIPKPAHDDRLPSDERNMLIFVSMLLLLGTLAIVAMASVGR